uniref:Uncharacterized protein n=1 Tax=Anguilla anguilla TaxID=7936 RepID=A0A0E9PUH4_ANGAN
MRTRSFMHDTNSVLEQSIFLFSPLRFNFTVQESWLP